MLPYSMYCQVCDTSWKTRREWLSHLLTDQHQRQARQDCCEWDEGMKECVLVIYTQVPVANSNELLQYFTKGSTIVTDFVYWPQRPRMALLQFESRSILDDILASGPQKSVGNYKVQLRRSADCLQLEWDELLSKPPIPESRSFFDPYKTNTQTKIVSSTNSCLSKEHKQLTLIENFAEVLKEVAIPNRDLHCAADIGRQLHYFFCKYLRHESNYCRTFYFRHHCLKYQTTGKNELIFFMNYLRKHNGEPDIVGSSSKNLLINEILESEKGRQYLHNVKLVNSISENKSTIWKENSEELGTLCTGTYRKRQLEFRIVTDPTLAPEAYTCNLLNYLRLFDTRIVPLIHLVSYWAKLNDKKLTKSLVTQVIGEVTYSPEPSLMEWLVVFFMCRKRIIPTPRQLTDMPHDPLMFGNFDIGIKVHDGYIQQWTSASEVPATDSSEFAMNVCHLAQECFEFLNNLNSEPFVLNMRDGELIKEHEFRANRRSPGWGRWLSDEEFTKTREKLNVESPLTIIHPLAQCQSFSFDREGFAGQWSNALAETAKTLKTFCEIFENTKDQTSTITLRDALTCSCNENR